MILYCMFRLKISLISASIIILFLVSGLSLTAQNMFIVPGAQNETIRDISEDRDGSILISTLRGLYRYNGGYMTNLIPDQNIDFSTCDNNGTVWYSGIETIGSISLSGAIKSFRNPTTSEFYHTYSTAPIFKLISLNELNLLLLSSQHELRTIKKDDMETVNKFAFQTPHENVCAFNPKSNTIISGHDNILEFFNDVLSFKATLRLDDDCIINSICYFDDSSTFYVATTKGLFSVPSSSQAIRMDIFGTKNILFIEPGSNHLMAVGIQNEGIYLMDKNADIQRIIQSENLEAERYICHLSDKSIWLSKDCNGIFYYQYNIQKENSFSLIEKTFQGKMLQKVRKDSDGIIWILSNRTISLFDGKNLVDNVFSNNPGEDVSMFELAYDGTLWCSRDKSLERYSIKKGQLSLIEKHITNNQITGIVNGLDSHIYFKSLTEIYEFDEDKGFRESPSAVIPDNVNLINRYQVSSTGSNTILLRKDDSEWSNIELIQEGDNVKYPYISNNGKIWFVTNNDAIIYRYDIESGKIDNTWNLDADYYANRIHAIIEDKNNDIWFGTSNGLIKIGKDDSIDYFNTGRKFDYYTNKYIDDDDNLYFSYSNGITVFNPDDTSSLIKPSDFTFLVPAIFINNSLFGSISSTGQLMTEDNNKHDERVKLKYNQNNFEFQFSCIDYEQILIKYSYRIDGIDSQWNMTEGYKAYYSNLAPGKYTFRVKIAGLPDSSAKSFSFEITKAPWNTLGARATIFAVLAALLAFVWNFFKKRQEQIKIQQEQAVKDEITRLKINFFTNLSHEFRTPLTLLTGPLKDLQTDTTLSEKNKKKVEVMGRSVTKLQHLANQILEYNNVDVKYSNLNLKEGDISKSLSEIAETFQYTATENGVNISTSGLKPLRCSFDEIKLNRIMSNILSNAIKYSPGGGLVTIQTDTLSKAQAESLYGDGLNSDNYVEIKVSDEGIGVPKEKLEAIFNRYERAEIDNEDLSKIDGFGIGLHYTRQLVTVHKGRIIARQNTPKGSIFSFILPMEISLEAEEEQNPQAQAPLSEQAVEVTTEVPWEIESPADEDTTILIVDDDDDIRDYLSDMFCEDYNILCASNGQDALDIMKKKYVDILICDVMMPGINGYQVCNAVKSDLQTSSIPVILLTAKNDLRSQIQGLNIGADAYIGKPFESEYLKAMVKNILWNRSKKQKAITSSTSTTLAQSEAVQAMENESDKKFIEKLYKLLDEHLSEAEINIDFLTRELGMSRTGFYMKLKGLTGKSPLQLINDYRMNRALEMLEKGDYSIKEISYLVGYEVRQSFTRSFKKAFGCNPTEYQEKLQQKNLDK